MITPEENLLLTEVGAGTPMGELLRRYWHPVAAVSELEQHPVKAIRLLGEELVLYRDRSGNYGLLERHCPHRRADLSYGFVEEVGLRCSYHGWCFDNAGRCIAQPFEEVQAGSRFMERVHVRSYRAEALAGMVFCYLGPLPAPLVPNWDVFSFPNGFAQVVFSEVPCNWLQCQENSIDPVHFEWLHSNWSRAMAGNPERSAKHLKIEFSPFEFGFTYRRLLEGEGLEGRNWSWPRLCILPNLFQPINHFEWRVPVDDRTTLSVVWQYIRVPQDREPYEQRRIPYWSAPMADPATGRWRTTHVMNQDFVAWVGQGVAADRTLEHLGTSDLGVRLLRRQLLDDAEAVARGEDPKGVLREVPPGGVIDLPGRAALGRPMSREEWLADFAAFTRNSVGDYFSLLAGQPEDVRAEFEEAMGITAGEAQLARSAL